MDAKPETTYKRLPGSGPRGGGFISLSFSRCSLYLGDDHILAVDSNGFSEDYKRFYFSDIQAIITRKTGRGDNWSIALALMIACALTGGLSLEVESARILSWILTGTFFVFLLIKVVRGPTCLGHIMTAVQEDQLPSLNRMRVTRRVIGILKAVIENSQGRLGLEEVEANKSEVAVRPVSSVQNLRRSQDRKHQLRRDDGTIHMIAFALMLADGILTGVDLLHHTLTMIAVSSLLTAGYSICIIAALVRQRGSNIPGTVRRITWTSLGFICVSYFLSYVLMMSSLVTSKPDKIVTQWDMYRAMLELSPQNSPLAMGIYAFAAASSLILGALGLVRAKKHRDESAGVPRPDQHSGGEVKR